MFKHQNKLFSFFCQMSCQFMLYKSDTCTHFFLPKFPLTTVRSRFSADELQIVRGYSGRKACTVPITYCTVPITYCMVPITYSTLYGKYCILVNSAFKTCE